MTHGENLATKILDGRLNANRHAAYDQLRALVGPVRGQTPYGGRTWVVTRYEQARAVLADPRVTPAPIWYLNANRYSEEWRPIVTDGLVAATAADAPHAQAEMEASLSVMEANVGRWELALDHYERSLKLRQRAGQSLIAKTPYPLRTTATAHELCIQAAPKLKPGT